MLTVRFSSTLRLLQAIKSLPEHIALSPCHVWRRDNGLVIVGFKADKTGLRTSQVRPSDEPISVCSWFEILPFENSTDTASGPFLIVGPTAAFARVAREIEQVARSPYRFRFAGDRFILQADRASVATLLRGNVRAYTRHSPTRWLRYGYLWAGISQYPLADHNWLLAGPDGIELLPTEPFREPNATFTPAVPTYVHRDVEFVAKINCPLRMVPADTGAPVIWALLSFADLTAFVEARDDDILSMLEYTGDDHTVVLRARMRRQSPPVLVLPGKSYVAYRSIPNVFIENGFSLRPSIRRDRVMDTFALAGHVALISNAGGTPAVTHIRDEAFKPLATLIEYAAQESQRWTPWVQQSLYSLGEFVEQRSKVTAAVGEEESATLRNMAREFTPVTTLPATVRQEEESVVLETSLSEDSIPKPVSLDREAALRNLVDLTNKFLGAAAGSDHPSRSAMWLDLTLAHEAADQHEGAEVSAVNALWHTPDSKKLAALWRRTAARDAKMAWRDFDPVKEMDGAAKHLLDLGLPTIADSRSFAALVYQSYLRGGSTSPSVSEALLCCEPFLNTRSLWLAWLAVSRMAGNDILTLANARDRLLARLHNGGYRIEAELPVAFRATGTVGASVFTPARLLELRDMVFKWAAKLKDSQKTTHAYFELAFAFGMARLSSGDQALRVLAEQKTVLGDPGHDVLYAGFRKRIENTCAGRPHRGSLASTITAANQNTAYLIDSFRNGSVILEPDLQVDPHNETVMSTMYKAVEGAIKELRRCEALAVYPLVVKTLANTKLTLSSKVRVCREGLGRFFEIGENACLELLQLAQKLYAAELAPWRGDYDTVKMRAYLAEAILTAASYYDLAAAIRPFATNLVNEARFVVQDGAKAGTAPLANDYIQAMDLSTDRIFLHLRRLGFVDILDDFSQEILKAVSLTTNPNTRVKEWRLRAFRAAYLYSISKIASADAEMERIAQQIENGSMDAWNRATATVAYFQAAMAGPSWEAMWQRVVRFFQSPPIEAAFTWRVWYQLFSYQAVEAAILALIGETAGLPDNTRWFLDDDELVVRRRVHREYREMVSK